jgi:antitoxin component YwqK of YwqJK toxin-antitoxin module
MNWLFRTHIQLKSLIMTRNEHLEFCKKCVHKKPDFQQGILCNLTGAKADFEGSCETFKDDGTSEIIVNEPIEILDQEAFAHLGEKELNLLRLHQDFYYAAVGGSVAAMLCAVIWAAITVATQYQIAYMAIGVGLGVGYVVQLFGAGIEKKFGYLGGFLALVGCVIGNLLSQVGFIAHEQQFGYFETITYLNFSIILEIMIESFHPMDVLFYGIAVYGGYKMAFRKISTTILKKLSNGEPVNPAYSNVRLPLVAGSIVILLFVFFKIMLGISGPVSYMYDSGNKLSEGELKRGKENGKWTYYYENGTIQATGFYNMGLPDSTWYWYDESGLVYQTENYKNGLENGPSIHFYNNGIVRDSVGYTNGRMQGFSVSRFESGNMAQCGFYKQNFPDSIWKYFYEDGQLSLMGKMKEGELVGDWTKYFPNGQIAEEFSYTGNGRINIANAWDNKGNQLVTNGNGEYRSYSATGIITLSGRVENGAKVGKWKILHENGKLSDEGIYVDEIFQIINSWDPDGNQMIKDGNGYYISYYDDGKSVKENGEVENGYRTGTWVTYYESDGIVSLETNYLAGRLHGTQKSYYESGQILSEGEIINEQREGKWSWYHANGMLSSTVNYTNNYKEGIQTMWSLSGEKTKEETYNKGVLINEKIL